MTLKPLSFVLGENGSPFCVQEELARPFVALDGPARSFVSLEESARPFVTWEGIGRPFASLERLARLFLSLEKSAHPFVPLEGLARQFASLEGPARPFVSLEGLLVVVVVVVVVVVPPPRILHVARADAQTNTNAEIRERAPEKCPPPACPTMKSKTLRLSDVLKCSCIRNETLADSNRLKNAGTIYSNVQINALNANLFRK